MKMKLATHIFKQRKHLLLTISNQHLLSMRIRGTYVVSRVIWDVKTEVCIIEHARDADQSCTPSWHDGDVLPSILAVLALTVLGVVEIGDGFPQRLNARGGAVLPAVDGDVEGGGAVEAALDIVVHLGGALAQVGPLAGVIAESELVGAFGAPDHSRGRTRRIEAGVGTVAFVRFTEQTVDP